MSKNNKTNSWFTPISKLMAWRGSWARYENNDLNTLLHLQYDQLLITSDGKILESFNMHSKIKGIYKDDVLILIISRNSDREVRKIKFQIKSNVAKVFQTLGQHFPIVKHNSQSTKLINSKYRNIDEVLKLALETKDSGAFSNKPADLNNFVKICLLDPTFPELVLETEKILLSQYKNTD